MKNGINDWRIILIACLTLGLAPFSPEPHIWGKLKWVMGGAIGMQPMDWFDLFLPNKPEVVIGGYQQLIRSEILRGVFDVKL
jgi:hypothetical protein